MLENGLFGFLFCLLTVCFQVQPGLAQGYDPVQCLISKNYNLIRPPRRLDGESCWWHCSDEPGCHMAVLSTPLRGPAQCLLLNCQNRGISRRRDPGASIDVYPKIKFGEGLRKAFMEGRISQLTGPELCYRPVQYGARPPMRFSPPYVGPPPENLPPNSFFFNSSSYKCEGFHFLGSLSNGNLFNTVKECEKLCGDIKGPKPKIVIHTGTEACRYEEEDVEA
ncbi:uncharacterized protein [Clinocottus analis]|uniref:uncharacterized protein n=1 Tax=Clinocottus analis TaxID=304258 RepID=UPI0035C16435